MSDEVLTLARLNSAPHKDFVALLAGTYEHSPWVSERAWPRGPFLTLAQPDIKKRLLELGVTTTPGTPAEFTTFVRNQVTTLQPVVKTVRITL